MGNESVSSIVSTLLTAPAEAVVFASREQRKIWIQWLQDLQNILASTENEDVHKTIIEKHLPLAPLWKMTAQISLGITMRIASIERREGGVSLGLGVGMIQASGTFGFSRETTSESVLQAFANYNLTNDSEISLKDYLSIIDVNQLNNKDDLSKAISRLGQMTTPPALP
ncbi:hypothetical protein LRP50_18190 [Enterovibrio sp. ZSDZ42]|uniref:PH domain-containing protein n=1 Tax=Enterovibrio gelatinilyticus TaxID=2899819 RepID=A0ABT5R477_9GAMM|nr:hypothetical protein [Enterovibrio sp. ZSDZ42]MDD1795061.1 hypothetical protein [Enterovibrio sp. ZSDZ42]